MAANRGPARSEPSIRIGLTMRVTHPEGYVEPRDSLAQDWHGFMDYAFPGIQWIAIPNLGETVLGYVESWGVDAFILTGGSDVGVELRRDCTELALIDHAISNELPVFGVCRGMQMLQHYHGGPIQDCGRAEHVATTHSVSFTERADAYGPRNGMADVNSYHGQGVPGSELADDLAPFALTEDGLVEGAVHKDHRSVAGVQWHPERQHPYSEFDRNVARETLGLPRA